MKFTINYTNEEFKRIQSLLSSLGRDIEEIMVLRNFKMIKNNVVQIIIDPSQNQITADVDPEKFTIPCIKSFKHILNLIKSTIELIEDLLGDLKQNWGKLEITDLHLTQTNEDNPDARCKSLHPVYPTNSELEELSDINKRVNPTNSKLEELNTAAPKYNIEEEKKD